MATETTTSEPKIADGWYLYREYEGAWWRALEVRNGRASGPSITAFGIPTAVLNGTWNGPRERHDPDISDAMGDWMGRLFREPKEMACNV